MSLATIAIPPQPGHPPITLTVDQVGEHFAIVPALTVAADGSIHYADHGPVLAHIPSGQRITAASCVDLRRFATALERLPIDWTTRTPATLTAKQVELVQEVFARLTTDPDSQWQWPDWAGDEAWPALSLLATQLDEALDHTARAAAVHELEARAKKLDPQLGAELGAQLTWLLRVDQLNGFGLIYLLAVLHRIDPAAADRAARDLLGMWVADDALTEWQRQWRRELAQGSQLTLHEFPDLRVAAVRGEAA